MYTIIKRQFIEVEGRHVHYRSAGKGPVLVMLHGSPNSSLALSPLIETFAERFTVVALDTPGNGNSDPLGKTNPDTRDYAAALKASLDALGIKRCGLYGFHTGAGTAMEYAAGNPARVSCVLADGYAAWTGEEKKTFLKDYLHPFVPEWDGSHLAFLWSRIMEQTMYFPWHVRSAETRMKYDMPEPPRLHQTVMEFLRAGDHYRAPYAAALRGDGAERLQRVAVPAFVTAHPMDPLAPHLKRLTQAPESVHVEPPCADPGARVARFVEWLSSRMSGEPHRFDPRPGDRSFVDVAGGQLRCLARPGSGAPLVLLHGAGESAEFFDEHRLTRPVFALDLPGHGESTVPACGSVADMAEVLAAACKGLGLQSPDVAGHHLGGQIGVEMSLAGNAGRVGLLGVPAYSSAERGELLENYAPSIEPRWDGAHLSTAWHFVRLQHLYYPWFRRDHRHILWTEPSLGADRIHRQTVDLLKAGDNHVAAFALQHSYATADRAAKVRGLNVISSPGDPLSTPDRTSLLRGGEHARACNSLADF